MDREQPSNSRCRINSNKFRLNLTTTKSSNIAIIRFLNLLIMLPNSSKCSNKSIVRSRYSSSSRCNLSSSSLSSHSNLASLSSLSLPSCSSLKAQSRASSRLYHRIICSKISTILLVSCNSTNQIRKSRSRKKSRNTRFSLIQMLHRIKNNR